MWTVWKRNQQKYLVGWLVGWLNGSFATFYWEGKLEGDGCARKKELDWKVIDVYIPFIYLDG
jgi:hypothetical protein